MAEARKKATKNIGKHEQKDNYLLLHRTFGPAEVWHSSWKTGKLENQLYFLLK